MAGRRLSVGPRGRGRMRARLSGLRRRGRDAAQRLRAGEPGKLWSRLNAVDFYGASFQLAALAILCFFPFLIVVTAAAGRNAAVVVTRWLGLHQQAAQDVAALFKAGPDSGSLTITSACLLVVGALAVAGTLQRWYERVFDVPCRGWRDIAAQICWLLALLAYGTVQATAGRTLGPVGGPVLQGLFGLVLATLFWWGSMTVLLRGAVSWRALCPAALATAVCWMGLGLFSAHFFSAAIVETNRATAPSASS